MDDLIKRMLTKKNRLDYLCNLANILRYGEYPDIRCISRYAVSKILRVKNGFISTESNILH